MIGLAEVGRIAKRSVQGWLDDGASSMGAALAFYTLFSMAPLLLVAITIAGFWIGREAAQDLLIAQLSELTGPKGAAGIQFLVQATHGSSYLPAAVGTAVLFVGATTVFNELKNDLDRIWRVHATRPKGFFAVVRRRLLSVAMVLVIGFLMLVSLVASTVISGLGEKIFAGAWETVRVLEFASSFLVVMGLFAMIYKMLPSTRVAWGDVWVGAAVTSVLFWLGKLLIGIYLGRAAVGSMFGAAGALVVLVAWVYYSAQVFLLGAEFTRAYAMRHGSRQEDAKEELTRLARPATEAEMLDRARRLVKGNDPLLTSGP